MKFLRKNPFLVFTAILLVYAFLVGQGVVRPVRLIDTDYSHWLILEAGSDLSANRILTLTTGDSARTVTLSGNPTLADWFDQAVKTTSSPTFAGLTTTGNANIATYGARVYNDALEEIAHNTWTALTFNSEDWDSDNIHSVASNTSRLTCTEDGKYLVFGTARFASNATGYRGLAIQLNAGNEFARIFITPVNGSTTDLTVSTVIDMSATDYVELIVYQSSGGALNVLRNANTSPEFGMMKIG
jgi:hypothetical protein